MNLTSVLIFVMATQVKLCICGVQEYFNAPTRSPEQAINDWKHLEKLVRNLMDQAIKQAMPYVMRMNSELDIRPECLGSLLKLLSAVRNFKDWAITMLDATGKPNGGQLRGSGAVLGSYDECLDITTQDDYGQSNRPRIKGMYCLVNIRPPLPPIPKLLIGGRLIPMFENYTSSMEVIEKRKKYLGVTYVAGFKLGVCLPSYCSKEDVQEIANAASKPFRLSSDVISCEVKETKEFDTVQSVVLFVICLFPCLVIFATLTQCFFTGENEKKPGHFLRFVNSFSVNSNVRYLLEASPGIGTDSTLFCLHGIRFFSMTWVVLGHTNIIRDFTVLREPFALEDQISGFWYQIIANGTLSVEAFFFMTAVLTSYNAVKTFGNKKFPISTAAIFILRRALKLLPSVMIVVGFVMLLPLFSSGPSWTSMTREQANICRDNWWTLTLFVNNFLDPTKMCLIHSWYLSVDMQLFLLGMVVLIIYFRSPCKAKILLSALTITSVLICTGLIWFLELTPTLIVLVFDLRKQRDVARYHFFMPHSHFAVYACGLALGVFLGTGKKLVLSLRMRIIVWTCAVLCCLFILFATVIWNNDLMEPIGFVPALYGGFHRFLWALGLLWLTLNCANGYANLLNRFLSWRGFIPLNRLTFLVYLVHVPVILFQQASLTGLVESSLKQMIWNFVGNLGISFGIAFVLKLLIDVPVRNIGKLIFDQLYSKSERFTSNINHLKQSENQNSMFFVSKDTRL